GAFCKKSATFTLSVTCDGRIDLIRNCNEPRYSIISPTTFTLTPAENVFSSCFDASHNLASLSPVESTKNLVKDGSPFLAVPVRTSLINKKLSNVSPTV